MAFARALVVALELYLLCGLGFALLFAWRGAVRVDPSAAAGTSGFRALLLPGATLLWPWLLRRWLRAARAEPGARS